MKYWMNEILNKWNIFYLNKKLKLNQFILKNKRYLLTSFSVTILKKTVYWMSYKDSRKNYIMKYISENIWELNLTDIYWYNNVKIETNLIKYTYFASFGLITYSSNDYRISHK